MILFGGVRAGGQVFCNDKCHQGGYVLSLAQRVPPDVLERQTGEVWRGNCPKCRGLGPVDVHRYHEVWSILVLTRWSTSQQVSCRSCAAKRQAGALAFSFVCGWWGFPWGLILTPVQVARNIVAMCSGPDNARPSADLQKLVQVNLGVQLLNTQQSVAKPPPLPNP
jgi:hypothetical protein